MSGATYTIQLSRISYSISQTRRELRTERRQLDDRQQQSNARLITRHLVRSRLFLNAQKIAVYLENDGEARTHLLIREIFRRRKYCYLPVLRAIPKSTLWFCEYAQNSQLQTNRFGISEPRTSLRKSIPPWGLDLVLLPLVGFDANGNRIGMGGGYYDKTFEFISLRNNWKKPKLVGLAHECQRLKQITPNPWDIPLNAIVTEQGYFACQ